MERVAQLRQEISRRLSADSIKKLGFLGSRHQSSLDPGNIARDGNASSSRFVFGRQSSMDQSKRDPVGEEPKVPENLDSTMQLLFLACQGDVEGVDELLKGGVDVNSIDLDGRTALHIAACEGHVDVVKLLLGRRANVSARDRWGSTAAADAKYYGNVKVYEILKARGAKTPKARMTPMAVSNPHEVPEYELDPSELQIRKRDHVSKGAYQIAKWNGTKVSVKILDKESCSDSNCINAFQYELGLLERVRHPNIVQFVGAVTQNVPLMIVLEYQPKGDLGNYLQIKGHLQTYKALRFALDIARGINYLHECKPDPIIHCDLKPKNLLVGDGDQLKISGFSLIRTYKVSLGKVKIENHSAHIDRSSLYLAPEVYRDEAFDRSVDTFSFGLILYEMIEGFPAFHPIPPTDAAKMICFDQARPPFKSKAKFCPPDLKELIEECWDPQPSARPLFSDIIVRLDKIYANCKRPAKWKEFFKLRWRRMRGSNWHKLSQPSTMDQVK